MGYIEKLVVDFSLPKSDLSRNNYTNRKEELKYLDSEITGIAISKFKSGLKMSISLEEVNYAEKYAKLAKRWLNPSELEAEYGFSKSTQSKMRMTSNSSTIPFSKIGGKYIRYSRVAIDKWLEEHQIQG
ncbi:MAG: helix-turn-helix domain-containing protein [Campylobacterales bacterium]|nr:helix-turn-helix domain-containing protein [Campylobacterales bacterium]